MTKDETYIDQARRGLVDSGGSEVDLRQNLDGASELWDKIQEVKAKMNIAKKAAAEEAAKPFLQEITELEEEYAFIIKLSS